MAWNGTTQKKYRRNAERYESDLTDGEWLLVKPLLPPPSKLRRPRSTDLREVFNAIRYMLATGCQWRAIPRCFPHRSPRPGTTSTPGATAASWSA